MVLRRIFFFAAASSCFAFACSSSSTTTDAGSSHDDTGTSKDAGHDAHSTNKSDATSGDTGTDTDAHVVMQDSGVDAGSDVVDSGTPYDGPVYTLEAGTTWSSLYRDYFSNTQTASCSASSDCHGVASDHGAEVSGYVCPGGDAGALCYAGITNQDAGFPLVTFGATFQNDFLSQILCTPGGGGSMPLNCTYEFTPTDIARIQAWVEAGAPNN